MPYCAARAARDSSTTETYCRATLARRAEVYRLARQLQISCISSKRQRDFASCSRSGHREADQAAEHPVILSLTGSAMPRASFHPCRRKPGFQLGILLRLFILVTEGATNTSRWDRCIDGARARVALGCPNFRRRTCPAQLMQVRSRRLYSIAA